MADSLIFGSFDEPIRVPAFCGACKLIPTVDSPKKHLPLDLAIEFFNRTSSFTTLDSLKLVCRGWSQLMHEPTFMPAYCRQTKNVCGFILQGIAQWSQEFVSLEDTEIDNLGRYITGWRFCWMRYGFKILASSKQAGVLLFAECNQWSRERKLIIGKATTDDWEFLPLPNIYKYHTVAMAVVVAGMPDSRYKIIRLSRDERAGERAPYCYHCEVFDSKKWKWEVVNDVDLGYGVYLDDSPGQPVTVGNLIHWLTTDHQVLAFNWQDNSYFRFPLPEIQFSQRDWVTLVDYEGKLGFMHTNREEDITRVWVQGTGGSWKLVREFELELSLRWEGARPVGLYNRDIVLLTAPRRSVFYNMNNSRILRSLESVHDRIEQVFPFRSDREDIDLRSEDRRHIVPTGWLV